MILEIIIDLHICFDFRFAKDQRMMVVLSVLLGLEFPEGGNVFFKCFSFYQLVEMSIKENLKEFFINFLIVDFCVLRVWLLAFEFNAY